jgi:hypothetical protein
MKDKTGFRFENRSSGLFFGFVLHFFVIRAWDLTFAPDLKPVYNLFSGPIIQAFSTYQLW